MRITQKDLAKALNISSATVSRALQNSSEIGTATRRKVHRLAKERNYRPSQIARSLVMKKTHTVGIIIPFYSSVFYGELAEGIQRCLRMHGYLGIVLTANTPEQEKEVLHSLFSRNIDGLLCGSLESEQLSFLRNEQIPFIFYNRTGDEDVDYVEIDRLEGGSLLTRHLLAHGYSDIAFLCLFSDLDKKFIGFRQELRSNGIQINPEWIIHGPSYMETGYEGMQKLLSLKKKPRAVFAANDAAAIGAIHAIRKTGLRVPDDIAVVGFDNIKEGRFIDIPLTTVSQMDSSLPEQMVESLLDKIEKHDGSRVHIELHPKLVIRESCGHHLSLKEEKL